MKDKYKSYIWGLGMLLLLTIVPTTRPLVMVLLPLGLAADDIIVFVIIAIVFIFTYSGKEKLDDNINKNL